MFARLFCHNGGSVEDYNLDCRVFRIDRRMGLSVVVRRLLGLFPSLLSGFQSPEFMLQGSAQASQTQHGFNVLVWILKPASGPGQVTTRPPRGAQALASGISSSRRVVSFRADNAPYRPQTPMDDRKIGVLFVTAVQHASEQIRSVGSSIGPMVTCATLDAGMCEFCEECSGSGCRKTSFRPLFAGSRVPADIPNSQILLCQLEAPTAEPRTLSR